MKFNYPLEVGNLDGLIIILFLLMLGPPILLAIGGIFASRKSHIKTAKILFISAGIYLLIGLGICGGLLGVF
ncbi:hypothetical protein ACEZ3G_06605 [Maribacter algicola]|uniref:Uncharacterized protein n=1 Tax=Meishania litoralis TaxID=3434685 RepID=A0ACC7LIS5_9FLAO